jgi:hypothetical protein
MADYAYVDSAFHYGPRKATLGLVFHCAEAFSGVVGYLSRDPARGVSASFVCENSGRMVRMLGWNEAAGALNPRDRSTNKAYYGHDHLVDVLGDYWTDPNAATIQVEIETKASVGPNADQVAALISWAADMKARFPSLRGALGHADQTDTKPCPGTTDAMKSVFAAIGGHGLWSDMDLGLTIIDATGGLLRIPTPVKAYRLNGSETTVSGIRHVHFSAKSALLNGSGYLVGNDGGEPLFVGLSVAPALEPEPVAPAASADYTVSVGGKTVGTVTLP